MVKGDSALTLPLALGTTVGTVCASRIDSLLAALHGIVRVSLDRDRSFRRMAIAHFGASRSPVSGITIARFGHRDRSFRRMAIARFGDHDQSRQVRCRRGSRTSGPGPSARSSGG